MLNQVFFHKSINLACLIIIIAIISSCSAPRTITHSGKVTPKGQLRFGANYTANISGVVSKTIFDGAESTASSLIAKDTIHMEESVEKLEKIALAYSLDPIGSGYDFYVRYGVIKNIDVGYKYASGVHVFDAFYQFLGSAGSIKEPGNKGIYGSIGLQYSWQKYDLPFGFDKIQDLLGYEMKRKDILIPLVFSVSFGEEEKIGCFSWGLAYNHSFVEYGFDPDNIFYSTINNNNLIKLDAIEGKKNYGAYGAFINVKAGYKFVYVVSSLSVFYQNYGSYRMLGGGTSSLKGITFIPSIGLQFDILKSPLFRKKTIKQ